MLSHVRNTEPSPVDLEGVFAYRITPITSYCTVLLYFCTLPALNKAWSQYFITPRLHKPDQGSSANRDSGKYLIFPSSGILTRSEGIVTQVSTLLYPRGGDSRGSLIFVSFLNYFNRQLLITYELKEQIWLSAGHRQFWRAGRSLI
jgi:hypothetical protein